MLTICRWTDAKGDTKWTMSNLVRAALEGGLALLDNVHRLPRSVLPFLSSLIENREVSIERAVVQYNINYYWKVTLYDGKRLVPRDVFQTMCEERGLSSDQFSQLSNIYPVHTGIQTPSRLVPPPSPLPHI